MQPRRKPVWLRGKKFLSLPFWIFSLLCAGLAQAADSQPVYWAGFGFTGDAASRARIAPHSTVVIENKSVEALNQALTAAQRDRPPAHLQIISNQLAKLDGSTSATVLAAALDRETTSIEPIGSKYKLLVEIAVQALFFDFREKQVIASYPVTLQYIDLLDAAPTDAQINAIFAKKLYGDGASDLPLAFARALLSVQLPNAAMKRLQIAAVEFSDAAKASLPSPELDAPVRMTLANEFSKLLSSGTGIGLLPPSMGEAIGGAMALRFSDQRVYRLKIPSADYLVKLRVDRFASRVIEETVSMRNFLFGAVFNVAVVEPLSGRSYFDQPLRKGATKVVPATQAEIDAWAAQYETLLNGLDAFSNAAAGRVDPKWLAAQQPGGSPLKKQLSSLQELISSCR
ncbi:hypothetical protein [Thermomonas brevis]